MESRIEELLNELIKLPEKEFEQKINEILNDDELTKGLLIVLLYFYANEVNRKLKLST